MVIILAYLALFFFLRGKLLFTPDLDRSDAFHFNTSLKYYLWQTLRRNSLPFWTQQLQGGFPLLAEGQIGALYLPNIIFYRLFSFTDAYMMSFVGSLFLFTFGFYMLLRQQRVGKALALLTGFSAAFAGFLSFRWIHLNVIQTVSLFPVLFFTARGAYFSQNWRSKLVHAFLISQLVFAGHIQVAFLALLSITAWYLAIKIQEKRSWKKALGDLLRNVLPMFLFSGLLSLPQVLPTLLLMQYAGRSLLTGYQFATRYSFPVDHVVSFVTPFLFGNPKFHTASLQIDKWGIFWENTPYIGEILSAVFAIALIVALKRKKFLENRGLPHICLAILFLILAFGSNSPVYFIFDLPPFSIFRTPAKYLIPSAFFLIWGASLYIERLIERSPLFIKTAVYAALICNIGLLVFTAFSYNVFVEADTLLSPRAVTSRLRPQDRYLTYGFSPAWGGYFAKHGWAKAADIDFYKQLNSAIIPQSNFIYGGQSFDINTGGLRLRRVDEINSLLKDYFDASDSAQTATRSAQNLLSITGVNTFISTLPLSGLEGFMLTLDKVGLYHYEGKPGQQGYYTPNTLHQAVYAEDFDSLYMRGKISTAEAMVEQHGPANYATPRVRVVADTESGFRAAVSSDRPSFFVIAKNWYPEWRVTLDGKPVKPVKTNLIHMGIDIPPGRHTVQADYIPFSFYFGLLGAFMGTAVFFMTARLKGWK